MLWHTITFVTIHVLLLKPVITFPLQRVFYSNLNHAHTVQILKVISSCKPKQMQLVYNGRVVISIWIQHEDSMTHVEFGIQYLQAFCCSVSVTHAFLTTFSHDCIAVMSASYAQKRSLVCLGMPLLTEGPMQMKRVLHSLFPSNASIFRSCMFSLAARREFSLCSAILSSTSCWKVTLSMSVCTPWSLELLRLSSVT